MFLYDTIVIGHVELRGKRKSHEDADEQTKNEVWLD